MKPNSFGMQLNLSFTLFSSLSNFSHRITVSLQASVRWGFNFDVDLKVDVLEPSAGTTFKIIDWEHHQFGNLTKTLKMLAIIIYCDAQFE